MRSIRRKVALLGAAALLGGLLAVPTPASAATQTLTIDVTRFIGDQPSANGAPAVSQRFLAPSLTVHKGDVLNFKGEFNTATAIPVGENPAEWIPEHTSLGGDYALNVSDPDEGLTAFKYNLAVIFPNAPNCGVAAAPCEYTGSTTLNSGALFNYIDGSTGANGGFSMTVNANPGDTFFVVDAVHPTITPLQVTVAAESGTATTQTEVDSQAETFVGQDALTAGNLQDDYANKHTFTRLKHGARRWDAWSGIDAPGVSLFDIYPNNINLVKGDKVRVHFEQLLYEIHTGTFPKSAAISISNEDFAAVCDPDGDNGSAPDTEADFSTGQPTCPEGSALEIDVSPRLLPTLGDGKWTGGNDLESSGTRSTFLPKPPTQGADPFDVKFTNAPAGDTLKFACAIHTNMVSKLSFKGSR